MLQLFSLFPT